MLPTETPVIPRRDAITNREEVHGLEFKAT